MNLSTFLRSFVLAASAAAPALAQTVVVRGELVDGRATGCYYCPQVQFAIKYSETPVRSSTIALAQFLGQQVELTGTWNGSTTSPAIDVTSAQIVAETLTINGSGRIGDRFRFSAHGTPGSLAVNAGAAAHGFVVPFGAGLAMLLEPVTTFVFGIGFVAGDGEFKTDVRIPNNPAFIGMRVFSQSLLTPSGGALFATNPRADSVLP